jgi:aryl-alcohol dehydrogenase-like predicted oxidoreductase
MKHIELPGAELSVAVVGLGTGSYGTAIAEDAAFELMDLYVEHGGNLLDTAHVYAAWVEGGWGASERTIGKWLAASGTRRDLILATKGAHHDIRTYQKRVSRRAIRQDLHESLERLASDHVDLYWLHRDDADVPVGEVLGWLNEHVAAGLIRAIGCSNWSVARQRDAAACAKAHGLVGFCASQVRWSLADFHLPPGDSGSGMVAMDACAFAYHCQTRVPVVAYSPQARGFFSGKYAAGAGPAAPGARQDVLVQYGTEANFRRLAAAQQLAAARGCSANQVALAWLFHQPFAICALSGARTPEQLADSCAAADLTLSQADMAHLARSADPASEPPPQK